MLMNDHRRKNEEIRKINLVLRSLLYTHGLTLQDLGLTNAKEQIKERKRKTYVVKNMLSSNGIDVRYFYRFQNAYRYARKVNGVVSRRDKGDGACRMRPSNLRPIPLP